MFLAKLFSYYVAFGFALFVCGIALFMSEQEHTVQPWYPAFFCFLPMAFYFVAMAHQHNGKRIEELEARIAQLEAPKPAP